MIGLISFVRSLTLFIVFVNSTPYFQDHILQNIYPMCYVSSSKDHLTVGHYNNSFFQFDYYDLITKTTTTLIQIPDIYGGVYYYGLTEKKGTNSL